jgi:hypothetical protein
LIQEPTYVQAKFVVDGKKDEVVWVIMTYILQEFHFHISGIDFPHHEIHIMELEKELISLNPHSFDRIEDYLAHVKELQLKLEKCGKNYQNKYGQLIELVLMN